MYYVFRCRYCGLTLVTAAHCPPLKIHPKTANAGGLEGSELRGNRLCTALQKMGRQDNRKAIAAQSNWTGRGLPDHLVGRRRRPRLVPLTDPEIRYRRQLLSVVEQGQALSNPGRNAALLQ